MGKPRFIRRTTLRADEYRKNFRQIDADVIAAVTSSEADKVTPLMSKIYLRLVSAPTEFWEREGVLYFSAGDKDGRPVKASKVLYGLLGVASATAHKALGWMHEQGIVGYYAGKNGVGIRIFLNRAAGSIGARSSAAGKKILPFARGSNDELVGSTDEPAFNDSYAVPEGLETVLNPRAPKGGAEKTKTAKEYPDLRPLSFSTTPHDMGRSGDSPTRPALQVEIPVDEIVSRLSRELEPSLQAVAERAAAREHERTREWLESRGLPKAARVAQHEAYNVLRKYGVINEPARGTRSRADVGRGDSAPDKPRPLTPGDIDDLAGACVALLETKGQSVEQTLFEMSADGGGFLPPDDVIRVRERANDLIAAGDDRGRGRGEESEVLNPIRKSDG